MNQAIQIPSGHTHLDGLLNIPPQALGLVLFVHGSGSGRLSPRNQLVAQQLNQAKLATLLFDLLTPDEDRVDELTREFRFDLPLLTHRLIATTQWCQTQSSLRRLPIGYFGASTGGGAALMAAASLPLVIRAVVSRGGRPDLAADALPQVKAPTLLLVGGLDLEVIKLNQAALDQLQSIKQLSIIPGATHLFEEPGTLEQVASLATHWFTTYFTAGHDVS